jgi:hypothetical protein
MVHLNRIRVGRTNSANSYLSELNVLIEQEVEAKRSNVIEMHEKFRDQSESSPGLERMRRKIGKTLRLDISNYAQEDNDFATTLIVLIAG